MELKNNPENVERFRRGDREVLAALYAAHVDAVEELLRKGFSFKSGGELIRFRGIREPFEVQEVLQEGFVRAFRLEAREHYDPSMAYRPYLITIFRNLVIDRFRRSTTEKRLFVSVGKLVGDEESAEDAMERLASDRPTSVGDPGYSPELEAMRQEIASVLELFVSGLDEMDSRILSEHLMGELSQNEMADALGISRNDLRKQIRLMRERLLRHLKSKGVIGSLDPEELFRVTLVLLPVWTIRV